MKRLSYSLLAVFAWVSGQGLSAQSNLQAQLEVNLGPIILNDYATVANSIDGITSGPNVAACSIMSPQSGGYRGCMQAVLSRYAQQGVVGVRFQFDMNGLFSTPFTSQSGTLSQSWKNSFSLFLQDLRAANMRYVSISPDWFTYAVGNMSIYGCIGGSRGAYTYNFACTAANANAVFYPWLPWAYRYSPADGQVDIYDAIQNNDYYDVPQLGAPSAPVGSPQPWPWSSSNPSSPLFNFFNFIFGAVNSAQLQVREFDLYPEIQLWASSVKGRMVYDNLQFVRPLDSSTRSW